MDHSFYEPPLRSWFALDDRSQTLHVLKQIFYPKFPSFIDQMPNGFLSPVLDQNNSNGIALASDPVSIPSRPHLNPPTPDEPHQPS